MKIKKSGKSLSEVPQSIFLLVVVETFQRQVSDLTVFLPHSVQDILF